MEVGLEFEHNGFAKCNDFSEDSFKPKKDTHVIRVWEEGHNSNYPVLVFTVLRSILKIKSREVLDRIEQ